MAPLDDRLGRGRGVTIRGVFQSLMVSGTTPQILAASPFMSSSSAIDIPLSFGVEYAGEPWYADDTFLGA